MVEFDQILSVSAAEMVEARVPETRLGGMQSTERIRGENGTLNPTNIVRRTQYPIIRRRKRQNPGGSEGVVQNSLSGYGLRPVVGPHSNF